MGPALSCAGPLRGNSIPMRPSAALQANREAVLAAVARRGTANPRVFGSVLYGTDLDESDLELLVDALPGTKFIDVCGLQAELELLLGVRVDVLTPSGLHGSIREFVVAEAKRL